MKSLLRSKDTSEECEAATFEQALQLAHQKFGSEAVLRCWKVRRGGVFGFFAKETFVAGLTQPAGAAAPLPRPGSQKQVRAEAPQAFLHDLVEATTDEVTLGTDLLSDSIFNEVLAEAEAALMSAVAIDYPTLLVPENPAFIGDVERIERLHAALSNPGLYPDFRPDEMEILDALLRSLAKLPKAPSLSKVEGSVLVVVGSRRDALLAAEHVLTDLDLNDSDLIVGELTGSVRQKVVRRRSAKKMTVLVLEAPLSRRGLGPVALWLDQLKPDYVLGAVPAAAKRSDFERWHAQLGRIDALALSRLENSSLLAELMGVLPIALLDGAPATTLRWVSVLLNSMLKRQP